MGKSDRAVFRVIGVVTVMAAVILLFLPIRASSSDAPHKCGTLIEHHEEPLRRAFCEERGAYRDRLLWVGGITTASCFLLVAGGRRQMNSTRGT